MMLVKNPAGFNQVINLIAHDEGNYKLAFLLNDASRTARTSAGSGT